MLIKRKLAVKAVVTDAFRRQITEQLRQALHKTEMSLQQLDLQGRRYLSELEEREPAQADDFRRKLERQKQRQETVRTRLVRELTTVEALEVGDEYPQGDMEGFEELQVGDNLGEKLRPAEILIRDGLVIEIRQG